MKKILLEISALFSLLALVLSFNITKNIIYSRHTGCIIFQVGLLFLCVGLGYASKLEYLEEIIILVLEVVIYYLVTWTNLSASTLICTRIAPITGGILALYVVLTNLKKSDSSDE